MRLRIGAALGILHWICRYALIANPLAPNQWENREMKLQLRSVAEIEQVMVVACVLLLGLPVQERRLAAQQPTAAKGNQPNIVFILVDDLGKQDMGCEGSLFYETPNIDRLASRSVRFENGYSACQVCSPSRASIQTGKSPARVNITDYINPAGRNQPDQWKRNTKLLPAPFALQLALEEERGIQID